MSLIVLASVLTAKAGVTLTFQPKVGATYKYQSTVVQSNPMMGGNQTVSSVASMNVKGLNAGYYTIVMTTSNVKITGGRGDDGTMKKLMEGRAMTLYINKYGSSKVDLGKGTSNGIQQMMNNLGGQGASIMYPKTPVSVGSTWSNTVDLGAAVSAAIKAQKAAKGNTPQTTGKMTMTYKLVSVSGNTATISCQINGTMNMTMGGGRTAANGQPMKMAMTMKGNGQYSVDRATGVLNTSNMKMNMGVMGQEMSTSVSSKRI